MSTTPSPPPRRSRCPELLRGRGSTRRDRRCRWLHVYTYDVRRRYEGRCNCSFFPDVLPEVRIIVVRVADGNPGAPLHEPQPELAAPPPAARQRRWPIAAEAARD